MSGLTRREVLVGAAASLFAQRQASAADKPKNLSACFKGARITDQYGEKISPELLFAKGPVIFIFGYNNCALCEGNDQFKAGIVDSIAAMQQELIRQKKNIPIVLVDVMPAVDVGDARAHVAMHYEHGIRQFADDTQADLGTSKKGEAAYDRHKPKAKEQKNRVFHIAYGPSNDWAEGVQSNMGLVQLTHKATNHSLDTVLYVDGEHVSTMLAIPAKNGLEDYRKHGVAMAGAMLDYIKSVKRGRN